GAIDQLKRSDADRAAGAMEEFDLRRQKFVNAIADDGMRLPATDFHQRPLVLDGAADRFGQFEHCLGVAIFVEVLHVGASNSSSCCMPSRDSKTRFASASSIRARAKPTCTSTYSLTRMSGISSKQTRLKTPLKSILPINMSCSR